jgi:hypothetical protein
MVPRDPKFGLGEEHVGADAGAAGSPMNFSIVPPKRSSSTRRRRKYGSSRRWTTSGSSSSAVLIERIRSTKTAVTGLRSYSRGSGAASREPQVRQKRATSGFSVAHWKQTTTSPSIRRRPCDLQVVPASSAEAIRCRRFSLRSRPASRQFPLLKPPRVTPAVVGARALDRSRHPESLSRDSAVRP